MQLASAKNSNRALQRELAGLKNQPEGKKPTPASPKPAADDPVPPSVQVPMDDQFDDESLQVPRIEMGTEDPIDADPPPDAGPPADNRPHRNLMTISTPTSTTSRGTETLIFALRGSCSTVD